MKKGLILALAIFLAACSNQNRLSNGQLIGTIGGGIIGAYVGSQFGGGAGSLLWMVTGAAVGGAAGFAFGDSLIPSDRAKFKKSTKIFDISGKYRNMFSSAAIKYWSL